MFQTDFTTWLRGVYPEVVDSIIGLNLEETFLHEEYATEMMVQERETIGFLLNY